MTGLVEEAHLKMSHLTGRKVCWQLEDWGTENQHRWVEDEAERADDSHRPWVPRKSLRTLTFNDVLGTMRHDWHLTHIPFAQSQVCFHTWLLFLFGPLPRKEASGEGHEKEAPKQGIPHSNVLENGVPQGLGLDRTAKEWKKRRTWNWTRLEDGKWGWGGERPGWPRAGTILPCSLQA